MKFNYFLFLTVFAVLFFTSAAAGENEAQSVKEDGVGAKKGNDPDVTLEKVNDGNNEDDVVVEAGDANENVENLNEKADDDVAEEHVSEAAIEEDFFAGDLIRKHPNLESHVLFTNTGNETVFLVGQAQSMLTGFVNKGKSYFVVQSLEASLRSPQQWDYVLFNFTARPVEALVPPKAVLSIEFPFRSNEDFEARDYGFTVIANYKDDAGQSYRHAVYNGTVEFAEAKSYSNYWSALLLLFAIGCFTAFYYVMTTTVYSKKPKAKKTPVQSKEQGTVLKADDDWLEGTNVQPGKSPRRQKSPKQSK